jgi:heme/copper-type cytochrome/quinol oxidase subunit 3
MNRWEKPLLINGAIVAVLFLFDLLTASQQGGEFTPRFALSGTLILLLAPINLIVGMIRNRNRKRDGTVYIALAGILLLIGFSVCTIQ